MAEIRLSKLVKQFNVGLGDLVSFLRKQGVEVDENPNAKVSDEHIPALTKQFGKDLEALEQARNVDIKLNEILEKTGKRTPRQEEEEEEYTEREITIKTNILNNARKEEPAPAPAPQPKPAPQPAPKAEPKPAPAPEAR
ncbi:MAG: hypothetical protein J5871_02230, partial [Bacteroidales bacterium]|nr:hypothetical protein [Bacteroidales bacterium]